jgi:hypothetical protein
MRHDDDFAEDNEAGFDTSDPDDATIECPHCGTLIYDDALRCPACGEYISLSAAHGRKPLWVLIGVAICALIVLFWIFAGF